jgi:hypothetical protein
VGGRRQLELPLPREPQPDRNFASGGRSFYFFDFDDNLAFLTTPIFLFHKETGEEVRITSGELAAHGHQIGKQGLYENYGFDHDPKKGSFRHFRDRQMSWLSRLLGRRQFFLKDLRSALLRPDLEWKGPSWSCFYHAVFNSRPVAIITARGHHPRTLWDGLMLLHQEGHLPEPPNLLGLYPVSHPEVQRILGLDFDRGSVSIPDLKRKALRHAVHEALRLYGERYPHRFGMSDDDPQNLDWIMEEMNELKKEYPHLSFFLIQPDGDELRKTEVRTKTSGKMMRVSSNETQLTLTLDPE